MINKQTLVTLVNKYYLGVNESVKWVVKNNKLTIDFMTPTKDVIGKVELDNFPLENCSLAVYDTKKLLNLISICNGDIILELESHNDRHSKLILYDSNFTLNYALSDPFLINKVNTVNIPEWKVELDLEDEDITSLLKAKSALSEVDNLLIRSTLTKDKIKVCEFIFGDESGHNNKITYQIQGVINDMDMKLPFNSDHLKMILYSNKGMGGGKLYISSLGLMKLEFGGEGTTSEYYMVRKSESNF